MPHQNNLPNGYMRKTEVLGIYSHPNPECCLFFFSYIVSFHKCTYISIGQDKQNEEISYINEALDTPTARLKTHGIIYIMKQTTSVKRPKL